MPRGFVVLCHVAAVGVERNAARTRKRRRVNQGYNDEDRMRKRRRTNLGRNKGVKAALDPDTLRRLYAIEGLSLREIAVRYDCSAQFISRLCREYDIPTRRRRRVTDATAE